MKLGFSYTTGLQSKCEKNVSLFVDGKQFLYLGC